MEMKEHMKQKDNDTSGQKVNLCGSCFKWNTKDCERFLPRHPNMPIWSKSVACDKFIPVVVNGG